LNKIKKMGQKYYSGRNNTAFLLTLSLQTFTEIRVIPTTMYRHLIIKSNGVHFIEFMYDKIIAP